MSKKLKILDIYFQRNSNYTVRREQLNGVEHIVVPVVMMVEGVHSGSHGPILHRADELGRYPESWDGIPVTIGHPIVDGQYVSANSPAVLQDWAVGRIFNTQIADSALKAEAWLDEVALQRISDDTLERINNGEVIEVSIGIFSDEEMTSGVWNNERYTAIARNHRPNHLALLPDEVGACSIADGCGIRVNKQEKTKKVAQKQISINKENQTEVLKELNRMGFSVNELGFSEIREKIGQAIYGLDGGGLDHYIEEVYADSFVYTQYNHRVDPRQRKLYKQSYKIDESGEVNFSGEPVHVKREVSYTAVPMVNGRVKVERVIKKNKSMCTDCVKKLADNLINNKVTAWSEDDREYLESQTEEVLEKMTPPAAAVVEQQVNTAKPTREEILSVFKSSPMSNEEFLSLASPEVRLQIQEGLELRTNQKNNLVTEILANTEEWPEDELKLKDFDELKKIHKLATKDSDGTVYVAGGGTGGQTKVKVNGLKTGPKTTPMLPMGVKIKSN
jgi:hypothetical protein